MTEVELNQRNVYFVAGYTYALAEEIVKERIPSLTEEQLRAETQLVWESILKGVITNNGRRRVNND
jgi:hypothetical protein